MRSELVLCGAVQQSLLDTDGTESEWRGRRERRDPGTRRPRLQPKTRAGYTSLLQLRAACLAGRTRRARRGSRGRSGAQLGPRGRRERALLTSSDARNNKHRMGARRIKSARTLASCASLVFGGGRETAGVLGWKARHATGKHSMRTATPGQQMRAQQQRNASHRTSTSRRGNTSTITAAHGPRTGCWPTAAPLALLSRAGRPGQRGKARGKESRESPPHSNRAGRLAASGHPFIPTARTSGFKCAITEITPGATTERCVRVSTSSTAQRSAAAALRGAVQ